MQNFGQYFLYLGYIILGTLLGHEYYASTSVPPPCLQHDQSNPRLFAPELTKAVLVFCLTDTATEFQAPTDPLHIKAGMALLIFHKQDLEPEQ